MRSTSVLFVLISVLFVNTARSQSPDLMIQGQTGKLYLEHTVAPKENWYSIGRLYNLSPKEIAPFNKLTLEHSLNIGEKLEIPLVPANFSQDGQKTPAESLVPLYYVVQEKEWMYRVSVNHNKVPIPELEKWNHVDKNNVKAGMKLIVGYLKVKTALSAFAGGGVTVPVTAAARTAATGTQPSANGGMTAGATAAASTAAAGTATSSPAAPVATRANAAVNAQTANGSQTGGLQAGSGGQSAGGNQSAAGNQSATKNLPPASTTGAGQPTANAASTSSAASTTSSSGGASMSSPRTVSTSAPSAASTSAPSSSSSSAASAGSSSAPSTTGSSNASSTNGASSTTGAQAAAVSTHAVHSSAAPLDFNGGFFKTDFSGGGNTISGMAGIFKSTSGWQDGKYYALMNNVSVGTIVRIKGTTGKTIYAKVLGQLPDMKESNGLAIRISNASASELEQGAADGKFSVQISY